MVQTDNSFDGSETWARGCWEENSVSLPRNNPLFLGVQARAPLERIGMNQTPALPRNRDQGHYRSVRWPEKIEINVVVQTALQQKHKSFSLHPYEETGTERSLSWENILQIDLPSAQTSSAVQALTA